MRGGVHYVMEYFIAANGEKDAVFRYSHASAHQSFQVSFIPVFSKAGHFSCRGHFNTEHHIGSCTTKYHGISLSRWYVHKLQQD